MNVAGKVAVVTGGAGGIGAALAGRLAGAGARVVVADRDAAGAAVVAERVGGAAAHGDVSRTDVLGEIFALAQSRFGPVDLFFANAGVSGEPGIGDSDEGWQQAIDVNVLAHVRAARLLVPGWLARGERCGCRRDVAGWAVSAAYWLRRAGEAASSGGVGRPRCRARWPTAG
jgi:NAD(P)-dependent dehydrogenase (short-subunit alcohol dehydrogenase family)